MMNENKTKHVILFDVANLRWRFKVEKKRLQK